MSFSNHIRRGRNLTIVPVVSPKRAEVDRQPFAPCACAIRGLTRTSSPSEERYKACIVADTRKRLILSRELVEMGVHDTAEFVNILSLD